MIVVAAAAIECGLDYLESCSDRHEQESPVAAGRRRHQIPLVISEEPIESIRRISQLKQTLRGKDSDDDS